MSRSVYRYQVGLDGPEEIGLTARWLRRRPGHELPAVYVEHNTPRGAVPNTRHPIADRSDIVLVHVTPFNDLMWDSGRAPTVVIEHGVPDPGHRYTGESPRAAVAINEPIRRWRVTGTDLLPRFAEVTGLDVFGMVSGGLAQRLALPPGMVRSVGDLPTEALHAEMARRRFYLHPMRWTSLGLSLIEAMHLGMPVVALATTEAVEAVPAGAGIVSTRVDTLLAAARELVAEPAVATQLGKQAREVALSRYGLTGFLAEWDRLVEGTVR